MKKNNFKTLAFFAAAMLLLKESHAQNIAPQSVNSAGTKMSQSNGSLSFTVGELVVKSQSDNQGNTLGGGFASGATLSTVSIQEADVKVLDVKVFPNPTTELVNIQINTSAVEQIVVGVSDLQGKEIYSGKHAAISNTIRVNTATYATGTYILTLKNNNNQTLGTYQIIKQ